MRVLSLLLLCAACGGPDNSLEGSIGESFSLDFDRVGIYQQDSVLRIEYQRDIAGSTHKVCKIVVETAGLDLGDDSEIKGDLFLERVSVQRIGTAGGNEFPPVTAGKITFEAYAFEAGGEIDGDFECAFDNGRTLAGNFKGDVEVVSTE